MTTAAIVVAGGRSSRFGSDKLRLEVAGRTLLERTLDAVAGCDTVVVVTAAELSLRAGLIAVSEWPRWGGPCAALAAGLDVVDTTDVLILPADLVDPEAAAETLGGIPSGVLADETGQAQWLLARGPVAVLRERVSQLRRSGLAGRPASALTDALAASIVPIPSRACADIDRPDDTHLLEELIHGTV